MLSDADSRAKYDRFGANWRYATEMGAGHNGGNPSAGTSGRTPDLEDLFGGGDLGSIFGNIFNRSNRGGRFAPEAPFPQTIEQPISVTLDEAFSGTTRLLNLASGDGATRRIEVKIPPGVREGSRIHVAADATARPNRDDVYLIVSVQPHPAFERNGDDLTVKVPVPLHVAVLGGEAQVPTLKGTKLALRIPEETQNGKRFRLRAQGMPRLNESGHGDLFAEVAVVLPTHLNEEERQLFERLQELRGAAKVST